eukprot:jgi/Ulvmu1/6679/UM030_0010.1
MYKSGLHATIVFLLICVAWNTFTGRASASHHDAGRQQALHHLFQSLDKDGDGQIQVDEVLKYIRVRQEASDLRVDGEQAAAEHFMAIDSNDGDSTVSEQELLRSLTHKLSGTSVENWVQYGLGLPQYRDNFIQNAVTVLDFPLFLEQQELLEQDLQITSVLHQRQILRAMHAIILGIGIAPHAVKNVRHELHAEGAMLVAWDPPQLDSHPPIRQLTVSRSCLGGSCHWEVVGAVPADASHFHDTGAGALPSEVQYRIASWSPVGRSPHAYSVAVSDTHQNPQRALLDSVGVEAAARSSTPWTAAPAMNMAPPPPVSRAVTNGAPDDEQSTFVRSITGVVVMLAAAGLLLQLLWTGAPLPADPAGPDALTRDYGSGESTAAPQDAAIPEARSMRSVSHSALKLSRRTLSWIHTISLGDSSHTAGSGHSTSSGERQQRAPSGRSDLLGSTPEEVPDDLRPPQGPPGIDAAGSMHALSAQDLAAVGCTLSTPVGGISRGASGIGSTGARSRRATTPAAGFDSPGSEGLRTSPAAAVASALGGAEGLSGRGSRHRSGTASPQPRTQALHRPQSYESLPPGGGGGPRPVRRSRKVLEKCNIKDCPYRPRSMVSALLHPTAEFHYCYRCQSEFCVNHMAWVTHGKAPLGKCPLDARCICELCWAELAQHGQPLPVHGRKPVKTTSFLAQLHQVSDPVSPKSTRGSPALISPRSVGSDELGAGRHNSPPISSHQDRRMDGDRALQPGVDAKVTGQHSKARLRLKWPFRRK